MKTEAIYLCCCAVALIARPAATWPIAAEDENKLSTSTGVVGSELLVESTTVLSTYEPPVETTTETAVVSTDEPPVETTTETAVVSTDEPPVETTTETAVVSTDEPPVETTTETATEVEITTEEVTTAESLSPLELSTVAIEDTTAVDVTAAMVNGTPAEVVKDKLSEQVRKILKHYQNPDPIGFPGAPIPDPLSIQYMEKDFGLASMKFYNMTVHGLSKFKVDRVNIDMKNMQVDVLLKIHRMYIYGNYTMKAMFSRPAMGPFNVTLMDVEAEALAALEPDEKGVLQATESEIDMRFNDCVLDFKNLGFMASMFQGVISSVGSVLFDGIKPFIINQVNSNLKADVNAQVKAITSKLPKMNAPMPDLAIAEGRAYVRRMGYDPYHISERQIKEGPLTLNITDFVVHGLSNFHRVGDIGLEIDNGVLRLFVRVITGSVRGSLRWNYRLDMAKSIGRAGTSNFTVSHIQVRAVINQTLDVRNKPVLDKLDIEVGSITAKMERVEPLDYVIEVAVNSLPALLRHIIVDVLEEPIKNKVQTILDDIQVEKLIEERLPELDQIENNSTPLMNVTAA